MKLHLVRPTESLCEHSIPPRSCGICWPEHVLGEKDARIRQLEEENIRLILRLAEAVKSHTKTLLKLAEKSKGKR